MNNYLFRISTKQTDCWSKAIPKPVYCVKSSKQDAEQWARENLKPGLSVAKISKLAEQVGGTIFIGL